MQDGSDYARSGVDYSMITGFKNEMIRAARRTVEFPNRRGVVVEEGLLHSHGGVFRYTGEQEHLWCQTTEGLGNKNWVAEWMREFSGLGGTFYENIGWDSALMAVNDVIAQGALPVTYTDEVAAGDSEWFTDKERASALAESFYRVCEETGMALVAGESPSLSYLVKPEPPVISCPSLSGCVVGIIAPSSRLITGENLQSGDIILGVGSNGPHCNGFSLIIKKALGFQESFLTKVPGTGNTLGEEVLAPTRSYVALIEALLEEEVDIHALVPGTGDGVAKLAYDKRPLTYRIGDWPEVPAVFQFFREWGISLLDCLKTFNWGVGYYVIVPQTEVDRTIEIGTEAGYDIMELGRVEEGERQVIFEPEGITLNPQGE